MAVHVTDADLWSSGQFAALKDPTKDFDHCLNSDFEGAHEDREPCVGWLDCERQRVNDVAGIDGGLHQVNGRFGPGFAISDGPLMDVPSGVLRKLSVVEVEGAAREAPQHRGRNNAVVVHTEKPVGLSRIQLVRASENHLSTGAEKLEHTLCRGMFASKEEPHRLLAVK